jgi:hypothetical protein
LKRGGVQPGKFSDRRATSLGLDVGIDTKDLANVLALVLGYFLLGTNISTCKDF